MIPDVRQSSSFRAPSVLALVFAVVIPMLVATAPGARAATPTIVLGRNKVGEFQGVRGSQFIAWQQNSRRHPGHYDVLARPLEGGVAFKVNPKGTNGANGGIDGDVLVYQQFGGRSSDLRLFDLTGRIRSSPPGRVNTSQWEYWPSISGDHLLFGRLNDAGQRRIILFDMASRDATTLSKVKGAGTFLAPGQVNGDYAVWSRCSSDRRCNVVVYRISDASKTTIPNPGGRDHAPSVTPDGVVYFARSGGACGNGTKIVRYVTGGSPTVLWRLPGGDDVGTTRAYPLSGSQTSVYYDHFACGRPAVSDVWEIVDEVPIQLTVTVEGNGSGTVTSSPPGIDCGSDCTEIYDLGTGVTLTATPEGDAAFAGWGGACTGTETTCSLTMDGAKAVTATFTTKPVLSVTTDGTGGGTITSSPPGIDCDPDCTEPYNPGTTVQLTASPNATSTFAGWSGACSGMGTCTVTMDASKAVIATFDAWPILTVSISGPAGSVASLDGGINCPMDCSEPYAPGTSVTLTATDDPPVLFVGWSGGGCSGAGSCVVIVTADTTVTATFA